MGGYQEAELQVYTCIEPSKKLEGDESLFGTVEQYHCIHHLLRGNLWVWSGEDELGGVVSDLKRGVFLGGAYQNIDDPKVLFEAVPNKLHTLLKQVEQLEVAGLQGGEMLGAYHGIQVPGFDS